MPTRRDDEQTRPQPAPPVATDAGSRVRTRVLLVAAGLLLAATAMPFTGLLDLADRGGGTAAATAQLSPSAPAVRPRSGDGALTPASGSVGTLSTGVAGSAPSVAAAATGPAPSSAGPAAAPARPGGAQPHDPARGDGGHVRSKAKGARGATAEPATDPSRRDVVAVIRSRT